MSVYSIEFSPTGGTKKVMEILVKNLFNEMINTIDLSKKDCDFNRIQITEEDVCLIGVPSYGGRVPKIVLDRMSQIKGNNAKTIIVVAYGNRAYDDTLLELKNELTDYGFWVVGAIAAVAEHSIMHQFGAERPDTLDEQELYAFTQQIIKMMNSDMHGKLMLPGKMPYREYGGVPFKPKANNKCSKCGICASECPVGAISKDNPSKLDKSKCISCMRCVAICPQKARSLNATILFMASFKMKKTCNGRKPNELFLVGNKL